MRVLKGLLIWFVSLFILLSFYAQILPADETGKIIISGVWGYIYLFVPILMVIFFSKKKVKKENENTDISYDSSIDYKYRVIIERKMQIVGSAGKHKIYFDGKFWGTIKVGQKVSIPTSPGKHSVLIKIWNHEGSVDFFVSECQREIYLFDEANIWSGAIKLKIMNRSGELEISQILDEFPMMEIKEETKMKADVKKVQELMKQTKTTKNDLVSEPGIFADVPIFRTKHSGEIARKIAKDGIRKTKTEIKIDVDRLIQEEQNWRRQQKGLNPVEFELDLIDNMDGHAFESWCAELLKKNGYTDVEVTKASNDQGVDIVAVKGGIRYAIQCKCYSSDLGNTPVQEINTGKAIYHCQIGVVMTNRYFTKGAKEAAEASGVLLWDRDELIKMIEEEYMP